MARTARIAHVVLGSPYATGKDGLVPSSRVLKLHLWAVSSVARSIAAVLVVLSTDRRKRTIAGYTEVAQESASMPCPVRVMHVANNSLGSYGMYLHAFAVHRTSFDYYVASEVDYVPVHVDFGGILARLYQSTFADRLGFLVGVMQGHPFERSKMPAHPQGVHVMSTRTLEQLYEHTYARGGWSGSMTARMLHLVRTKARSSLRLAASPYDFVQVGFGMLLEDAGIEMRDFSSIYRTPYWNHQRLLDWTGVTPGGQRLPMNQTLFAPVQALFLAHTRRCCGQTWDMCKKGSMSCTVADWRIGPDCCTDEMLQAAGGWKTTLRRQNRSATFPLGSLAGADLLSPPSWLHGRAVSTTRRMALDRSLPARSPPPSYL